MLALIGLCQGYYCETRTVNGQNGQQQITEHSVLVGSQLSWEDVHELKGEVITLFCIAFGFLVLKKLF
ncbi:hypothetical protein MTX71_30085 [Pseudomonas aeruginosa]|uniref:hypothetical protein n=1 Tax=Pseudomonas aeruginosa TaxID=287 RepID=UPI002167409F|nr:hypothetical protein [Pseudomonas aeruginosa]UVW75201.1 hypothetical protein MTX71_30085 [Pseudomonas aeruginosa]